VARDVRVRFAVRLTPRGGRDAIEGIDADGAIRIRVAAPPAEGAANRALVRLLASHLGVGVTAISIVSGATARRKVVEVSGRTPAEMVARLPGLAV